MSIDGRRMGSCLRGQNQNVKKCGISETSHLREDVGVLDAELVTDILEPASGVGSFCSSLSVYPPFVSNVSEQDIRASVA